MATHIVARVTLDQHTRTRIKYCQLMLERQLNRRVAWVEAMRFLTFFYRKGERQIG
jgi:hypothetical protein